MYAIVITDLEIDRQRTEVDWNAARCRDGAGTLTHLFFSDDVVDIARAKAICARCTESAACLSSALERAEPWGVWGGELLDTGRIVSVKRPRGRPPVHARPVMVVDEDRNLTVRSESDESDRTRIAC
jgi:hypothetical protein